MANSRGWKSGRWKAVCDRCGFRFHSDALRTEWTGLKVCGGCWESRHPQDFVKLPLERITPPWTRPEVEDVFQDIPYVLGTFGDLYVDDYAIYMDLFSLGLYNDD